MKVRAIAAIINDCSSINKTHGLARRIIAKHFDEGTTGDKQKYLIIVQEITQRGDPSARIYPNGSVEPK